MNIDDVNNILGYMGEKGAYYDSIAKGNYTPTKEAMKIVDIVSQKGEPALSYTSTPDGRDITTYYSDEYYISKTSENIKNTANKDLVYNAENNYWLASPCVCACFSGSGGANFNVRYVNSTGVSTENLFVSSDFSICSMLAVRPVVKLDSSVKLVKDATAANTWNISK